MTWDDLDKIETEIDFVSLCPRHKALHASSTDRKTPAISPEAEHKLHFLKCLKVCSYKTESF